MAAEGHRVTGVAGLARPTWMLAGASLLATLFAVAACEPGQYGFRDATQTAGTEAADAAPAEELSVVHAAPVTPPQQAAEAGPPPPYRLKPARLVTVAWGDSVHGLASRHGVTARAIIELNGLTHPYWLLEGTGLRLPEDDVRTAWRADDLPATAPLRAEPLPAASAADPSPAETASRSADAGPDVDAPRAGTVAPTGEREQRRERCGADSSGRACLACRQRGAAADLAAAAPPGRDRGRAAPAVAQRLPLADRGPGDLRLRRQARRHAQ